MTPQKAISEMIKMDLSQSEIALLVSQQGTTTTQETICRIGSGSIKKPSFELGTAIVSLFEALKSKNAA